jgi:hypothetical protein
LRRFFESGFFTPFALLTKQTALFPSIALLLVLHFRKHFKAFTIGFATGALLLLAPILVACSMSFTGLRDAECMLKPRYTTPLMYSFNGVSSLATLIHRVWDAETMWAIERWYIFTAALAAFPTLYAVKKGELYTTAMLYYLLFTATYWGINYQYLTTLITLLATAIAKEEKRLLKALYTALAIYIALWLFIFPVEWRFRAHIEKLNVALLGAVKSFSLNIYADECYAYYSLALTMLEYIVIAMVLAEPGIHCRLFKRKVF